MHLIEFSLKITPQKKIYKNKLTPNASYKIIIASENVIKRISFTDIYHFCYIYIYIYMLYVATYNKISFNKCGRQSSYIFLLKKTSDLFAWIIFMPGWHSGLEC